MKKQQICRRFPGSTCLSTGVEDGIPVSTQDNGETRGAAISGSTRLCATVENFASGRSSILPAPLASKHSRERRPRETHLSAERTSPEAATRIQSANGLARRPRDPEAASCERAQAPLRLRRSSCSAATDFPVHGTSTPSIDVVSRPRPDISSCTGSRVTRMQTERHASASRYPGRWEPQSSGIV